MRSKESRRQQQLNLRLRVKQSGLISDRRKGPTCSDQHEVGHGRPVELIVGDERDVPAGGDSRLVRESQQESVVVRPHQVDVLDVT